MHRHGRREPFGCVSMSWHKSKHRLTLKGFTFQGLGKIDAINYMILRVTHVHHLKNRGIEIVCLNAGIVDRPRLGHTWPDHDCGYANTSLADTPLSSSQWIITGYCRDILFALCICFLESAMNITTVIRIKNNDGIFQLIAIECVQ